MRLLIISKISINTELHTEIRPVSSMKTRLIFPKIC